MDQSNIPSFLPLQPASGSVLLPPQPGFYGSGGYRGDAPDLDNSDSTLLQYWRILLRNKGVIVFSALAGLLVGFGVGIPMKPVYRAQTALEVLTLNGDFMNMKQANPTTTNDFSYDTSEEQTQAKLLQSGALLNRVVGRLDPSAPPRVVKTKPMAKTGWRSWLHLAEPQRLSSRQAMLVNAANTLKVRPTARTRVIELTVDSTDPQLASDFANTLTQEFIAQNMEARWATTEHTSEWLKRELDDARDRLRKSEDALQHYASASRLIFTDETTNVATEKLQQVQQSLSLATTDRIAKQSRYELAQHAPADTLGDVLADTGLRETEAKINDLKRQIADLSAVFAPEYSKVRRLQAELESLQPAFDRQRAYIISRIKNDYTEASRKESLLLEAYNKQIHEVTGQDEKAIQYNILKRDVDSNRQLYDTMLQQMKQASIASAMRASNVRIVDPAPVPDFPISPNFKLNSVIGLFSGLLLSMVFVAVKERADRAIYQPGDIKLFTDILELGVIPAASATARDALYYRPFASLDSPKALETSGKRKSRAPAESIELITFQKTPSVIAEAFRSTLTSVLFVGEAEGPKVLVFTSANAADGKTTVVSNLSIAAAEIRKRVLVIDADLRRPRMHTVFNVENERGLVDILRGGADASDLPNLIQNTQIEYLSVLPAGVPTQSASHLLYSPMWPALLETLRAHYDMILIDTPPMLQMTDARVAARHADAVILVGRAGQTTRDAILAARQRLGEDRIKILGAVLNGWNPKNSPGGYYGHAKSHYYSYSNGAHSG